MLYTFMYSDVKITHGKRALKIRALSQVLYDLSKFMINYTSKRFKPDSNVLKWVI